MTRQLISSRIDSLADLDPQQLNELTQGRGVFSDPGYLQFMERMRTQEGVWYAVARDEESGDLLGVLPIYEGGASVGSYWDPFAHYLRRAAPNEAAKSRPATLFVGIRSGFGWAPLIAPHLSSSETAAIWSALLERVRLPLAAMFLSDAGRASLLSAGIPRDEFFLAGATSVIDLRQHQDFASYVGSLPTPGAVRREKRIFDASGGEVIFSRLRDQITDFAPLFVALTAKYGHPSSLEDEMDEMVALDDVFGDRALGAAIWREDRMVAALALLEHDGTLYLRQIGFDYSLTGAAYEYFNLAYYSVVEYAITNGLERIDYGQGTYRAKHVRGARVEPLWGLAWNEDGRSILTNPQFKIWDMKRVAALESGSIDELEGADLP